MLSKNTQRVSILQFPLIFHADTVSTQRRHIQHPHIKLHVVQMFCSVDARISFRHDIYFHTKHVNTQFVAFILQRIFQVTNTFQLHSLRLKSINKRRNVCAVWLLCILLNFHRTNDEKKRILIG